MLFCAHFAQRKRVKFVSPPKEIPHSFLFVQFWTNYDVANIKQYMELVHLSVQKWHKESQNCYNRDYLWTVKGGLKRS